MPTQTFEEFETDLEHGRFRPVYFLFGQEDYLMRQAVLLLKAKAIPPDARAFNLVECSARSLGAAKIVHEANSFPLMLGRRLVLATDIQDLAAEDQEKLASYIAAPQEKTTLALVASEMDRRTSFYRRLTQHACVVEFPKLKDGALLRWAGNRVSRRGFRISPPALQKLVDLAGSDLLSLENEIEKLILYSGPEKEIPEAAVDSLVPASRQHRLFELTSALARRDRKAALGLLGNLLEAGEPPLVIVTTLARHFRQALIAKEMLAEGKQPREIKRAAQIPENIPENAFQEFLRHLPSLDPRLARSMFQRLARIDRSFKSTSPDERIVLERWVCSL